MRNNLWDVINTLALKGGDLNQSDLAFAETLLSKEQYLALEEHLLEGQTNENNQWV